LFRAISCSTLAAVLCVSFALDAGAVPSEPVLPASTSWIGNSFGYGDGTWTPINIAAIAVAPDGRVYTNAPWDESGAEVSIFKDGKMLGFAGGTHGWGNTGGSAIAINKRYAYIATSVGNEKGRLVAQGVWPESGQQWFGVSRRVISDVKEVAPLRSVSMEPRARLAASFLMMNQVGVGTRAEIGGLAANDSMLYAANTTRDEVDSYDAASMQPKNKWTVHEPGRLAIAGDGTVWVLAGTLTDPAPHVEHYSASGQKLDDTLPLPADSVAVDITVDDKGRVLIADNGPRQQVLIFSKRDGRYALTDTLGERGGIFAGPPGQSGRPGPLRFNGLTGLGVDAAGNIYVSTNGIGPKLGMTGAGLGATLESYAPDGRLRWQVQGLLFVDGAWMDPGRPNSVFTGNKRFELDLSKPAGQQWKYAGFLSNRFKYPQDPVFNTDQWPGLPMARKLDGRTFLYLTDMYADHLKIYRFDPQRDGETAIPSGLIAGRARPVDKIPNRPPGGDWIWRDTNGDGKFDSSEFTLNTTKTKLAGGWGWWVDTKGDIWRTSDQRGIHRFRYGGLDSVGNPIYSYTDMTTYPMPAPFSGLRRAIYEPQTDTLYVTGYTADAPAGAQGTWKEVGRLLVRYDKWSTGSPVQRYAITLPWDTNAKPIQTLISVTVEGKYLFAVEPAGDVHVYDKATGGAIGVIKPGPEVGNASGWIDVPNGISAHQRDNGEYLVFVEEDARGKVMMYRWKPQ